MSTSPLKRVLHRKNSSGSYDEYYLKTSSDIVYRTDGTTTVESSLSTLSTNATALTARVSTVENTLTNMTDATINLSYDTYTNLGLSAGSKVSNALGNMAQYKIGDIILSTRTNLGSSWVSCNGAQVGYSSLYSLISPQFGNASTTDSYDVVFNMFSQPFTIGLVTNGNYYRDIVYKYLSNGAWYSFTYSNVITITNATPSEFAASGATMHAYGYVDGYYYIIIMYETNSSNSYYGFNIYTTTNISGTWTKNNNFIANYPYYGSGGYSDQAPGTKIIKIGNKYVLYNFKKPGSNENGIVSNMYVTTNLVSGTWDYSSATRTASHESSASNSVSDMFKYYDSALGEERIAYIHNGQSGNYTAISTTLYSINSSAFTNAASLVGSGGGTFGSAQYSPPERNTYGEFNNRSSTTAIFLYSTDSGWYWIKFSSSTTATALNSSYTFANKTYTLNMYAGVISSTYTFICTESASEKLYLCNFNSTMTSITSVERFSINSGGVITYPTTTTYKFYTSNAGTEFAYMIDTSGTSPYKIYNYIRCLPSIENGYIKVT